jgi:preprotein translocase subunit SecY
MRQAWADEELRSRITFVLLIFVVYALGIVVPVPVPNVAPEDIKTAIEKLPVGALMNMFGGGALSKLSIFALGLGPYITASIIMQVLTQGLRPKAAEQENANADSGSLRFPGCWHPRTADLFNWRRRGGSPAQRHGEGDDHHHVDGRSNVPPLAW